MSKIVLGTAQFGLDYGINNQRGKIPDREISDILVYASANGVETLDTAAAYGDSEERIGRFMTGNGKKFKIVTKLPKDVADPARELDLSLAKLQIDSLYGYLFHDFQTYAGSPDLWGKLRVAKSQGKISKLGLSLYYPFELERVLKDELEIDLVQIPYNIFDRRFEPYLSELKKRGTEVHVRSVFLQGLFFREIETLSPYFNQVRGKLTKLRKMASQGKSSLLDLLLGFALLNPMIDKVVVGVDNLANLQEIIKAEKQLGQREINFGDLDDMQEDDEVIILPFNWEKERSGVR